MSASLDLFSITPGGSGVGSFTGALDGVSVTGSISGSGGYQFNGVSGSFSGSTIDNTSPQFTDPSIYTFGDPIGDRVGYANLPSVSQVTTVEILFGAPVLNPILHVANMDASNISFAPSGLGVGDLVLLSGNGGPDGDGLTIDGSAPLVQDANPSTSFAVDPGDPIPTTGSRSAYGSVQLMGTFTSLTFEVDTLGGPESGSFTLSGAVVPPPPPQPPAPSGGSIFGGFVPPPPEEVHAPPLNVEPNNTNNDIETDDIDVVGTDTNDNITLGSSDNTLTALDGNDNAFGGDGDDFIQLNQGNDYALGQGGNDTIWGGMDDDYAEGNDGNDLLEGHVGDDTLWGADSDDSLFGGLGNALPVDSPDTERDFLDGGSGNDFLNGNAGNDTVYGAAGDDTVLGGKNDDLVVGGSGNDEVSGQEGNDTLYGVFIDAADPGVGPEIDTLTGGGGADTFVLGVANQRYYDSSIATDDGGNRDYALLTDFNPAVDFIQLAGAATDYSLQETSGSLPNGIGIFFESDRAASPQENRPDELIAIVQGVALANLDLNSSAFNYV